jgi:hypothetical protein
MGNSSNPATSDIRPRLWVETLWLLESLTVDQPLREILLKCGLNLIVSPPRADSPGHGVGKTAFCQLLRFVLDDPLWSEGSTLRDELLQSRELQEGAVAARVHIGDETWTVLKPWRHQKHYRASRTADWRQLAASEVESDFNGYQEALRQHLVEILPAHNLPGSKQVIEWHQILAWCSRDQNARYQSYFQWRAEGVGFSQPAKAPIALMQVVLGLLRDADTLRELEESAKEADALKTRLQELREEPERLLKHVRRQLNRHLSTSDNIPFRQDGLYDHPNLVAIARQRHEAYLQEQRDIDAERQRLANERQSCVEKRAPLKSRIELVANEVAQHDALIAGDSKRVEELRNEASSLQQILPTKCDAGNRLLQDCQYVIERLEQTQIDRMQRINQHQRSKESLERDAAGLRDRLNELKMEVMPIDAHLKEIDQSSADLDTRYAQSLSAGKLLSDALDDYDHYESVVSGRTPLAAIVDVERRLDAAQRLHARLRLKSDEDREATSERREIISGAMQAVARSLPSFSWGVFNDSEKHRHRPFQMGPMHSTTFGVLEILAGDIACLLDSTSAQSFHPGFLLHDSPREAEMSDALFWALLKHVALQEKTPFQYIVTTSTQPDATFNSFVRLDMASDNDDGLLLCKRIGVQQAPIP